MDHIQEDYLKYYLFLKSNARRGVNALRSILADNLQAKAFAENPAAVAVVLSYDKANPDKNAETLYELLTQSSVAELASGTYICSAYGVSGFDELFADDEILAQVLVDEASMNALAASGTAMASLANDAGAMADAAASEIAMAAIFNSKTATDVVVDSGTAMAAVAESDIALSAAFANDYANEAVHSSSAAESAIASSKNALDYVMADASLFTSFAGSDAIMGAVLSDAETVDVLFADSELLAAVSSSEAAMGSIYGSSMLIGKYVAVKAGLDHTAYSDIDELTTVEETITALAGSAEALHAVCKSSIARTSWMTGGHVNNSGEDYMGNPSSDMRFETIYETLHNASDALFVKYEEYYNTTFEIPYSSATAYAKCSNASGGFSDTSSTAASHEAAVPIEGITLLSGYGAVSSSYGIIHYGSSQTKEDLTDRKTTSAGNVYSAENVFVGGMSWYNEKSSYRGGNIRCQYATYIAV